MNKVTRLLKQFDELKIIPQLTRIEQRYLALRRNYQQVGGQLKQHI